MKRLLLLLLLIGISVAEAQVSSSTASRIFRGVGNPATGCTIAGDVGKVYFRQDGAASNNLWLCESNGGTPQWVQPAASGATAFSAITAGTNTSALVIGAGGTFTTSGTGKNQANFVLTGSGAPASTACDAAGEVGSIYVNSDTSASQKKLYVCIDTGSSTFAWIQWQDTVGLNSAHGGGTEVARGTVGAETAIANGDSWVYSTDAGINRWTNRALKAVLRTHGTDCTALTDGVKGQACYEDDSDRIFVCEPTAGLCDTAGEWILASGSGAGTVTSVATGCGLSGGPITTSGTAIATLVKNDQTGTTYSYVDGDCGKIVTHSAATAIAGTLPSAAGAGFDAGWFMDVENRGAGLLTITPTTSTIDGATSLTLATNQGVRIASDGTNYFTQRGRAWEIACGAGASCSTSGNIVTVSVDTAVIPTLAGVQSGTPVACIDAGANDTYTCSLTPALTAYTDLMAVNFRGATSNTTAATLNINGLGPKDIKKADCTTDPATNDILAGQNYLLHYKSSVNAFCMQATGTASAGTGSVECTVDGGGDIITTGAKCTVRVPYTGTIARWSVLEVTNTPISSSIEFRIWKDTYANYPPTVADDIVSTGTNPNLTSATKGEGTTFTSWTTTTVTAGDVIIFEVETVTSAKKVNVQLWITKS